MIRISRFLAKTAGSFFVALVLIHSLSACQNPGVKPWDRDILAQPAMEFDSRELDLSLDDHFYFSKEGTSGGRGFAGGGCGCN